MKIITVVYDVYTNLTDYRLCETCMDITVADHIAENLIKDGKSGLDYLEIEQIIRCNERLKCRWFIDGSIKKYLHYDENEDISAVDNELAYLSKRFSKHAEEIDDLEDALSDAHINNERYQHKLDEMKNIISNHFTDFENNKYTAVELALKQGELIQDLFAKLI